MLEAHRSTELFPWAPGIELMSQACCVVTNLCFQPKLVCFETPESTHAISADTGVLSVTRTALYLLKQIFKINKAKYKQYMNWSRSASLSPSSWGVLGAKPPDLTRWRKVTNELHPLPSRPTVGWHSPRFCSRHFSFQNKSDSCFRPLIFSGTRHIPN